MAPRNSPGEQHAIALRRDGGTLPLETLDVLRGAALRAAVERLGSVKDAYLLFGGDALVETRNQDCDDRVDEGRLM